MAPQQIVSNSRSLSGRVAVVTGGSSGLGRASAISLAAAGARVAILGRSLTDLQITLQSVLDHGEVPGPAALAIPVDLADANALAHAMHEVREQLGPVDILVNAAGTDTPGSIEELDVEGWDRVLNVNLRAVFLLSKEVFPGMRAGGGGTIINIGSVAGRRGWANASAYCASKFALTGLTQATAAEGRAHGIRVCLLYPGAMDTNWGAWSPEDRDSTSGRAAAAESMPPDHVAELITWIAQSPADIVLNEVTVTPLLENGWP
jgi:NAD(P)-dependent dehydrogenase (short-subunit alcohol dehydrogenase family)